MGILGRAEYLFWEKVIADQLAARAGKWIYRRPQMPPKPSTVRSVLVWCLDSPGDCLLVSPLFRSLRQGYPEAKITLLHNLATTAIFETLGVFDERLAVEPQKYYSARGFLAAPSVLKGRQFDVVVVPEMGSRPTDAARIWASSGDSYVVTGPMGHLKRLQHFAVSENQGSGRRYWGRAFLEIAEHLGLPQVEARPYLPLTDLDRKVVSQKLSQYWSKLKANEKVSLAIHPFVAPYARKTKQWPPDRFVSVIRRWLDQGNSTVVLTGGAEDRKAIQEQILEPLGPAYKSRVLSLAGELTLRQTAAVFSRSSRLLTQDTVALHLANSQRVPTVALFGATDPKCLAGDFEELRILGEALPCQPCFQYKNKQPFWPKCIYDSPKCMEGLNEEQVLKALAQLTESRNLEAQS